MSRNSLTLIHDDTLCDQAANPIALGRTLDSLDDLCRLAADSMAPTLVTDAEGRVQYANSAFCAQTAYDAAELRGRTPRILRSEETPAELYRVLWSTIKAGGVWRGELANRRKNGEVYPLTETIWPVVDAAGVAAFFIGTPLDMSEARRRERQLWRQTHLDPLTGLPGRRLLLQRLDLALQVALLDAVPATLVLLDLERFADFNQAYGHRAGDAVLCEAAERLGHCLRQPDLLARIERDGFAILLSQAVNASQIARVAQRLKDSFTAPFSIPQGGPVQLRCSLVVVRSQPGEQDPARFLRLAAMELRAIKRLGRGAR